MFTSNALWYFMYTYIAPCFFAEYFNRLTKNKGGGGEVEYAKVSWVHWL